MTTGVDRPASPVRILYLIDELDIGGTEQQMLELFQELDRERYEPHVACFRDKGRIAAEIEALGIPVTLIPKTGRLDPRFFWRLVDFVRETRPRIVQTYLFTANTWGRLAAWLCRAPVIIGSERNVDDWKGPVHKLVDRVLACLTTVMVANAGAIKAFMVEQEGLRRIDIRVIHNGVRWQRFTPRAAALRPANQPLIGIVGRLELQKDHDTCLRAFARLKQNFPNARLRVIGDGSLRHELQESARTLGLRDSVEFPGPTRDLGRALADLDLVVVSSTREGCCNAILEAMSAGVPVVATNVGGNPELVAEGETGYLVPPRNPEALALAMGRLLAAPEHLAAFSKSGQCAARERFSVEAMTAAHERLYEELLSPPRKVCYVIDDLALGGAQQQLLELIRTLPRDRFLPEVISLSTVNTALADAFEKAGVPLSLIPQSGKWSWSAFAALWKAFRKMRPDLVQTWLFTADLYGRPAAWLAGVPVILSAVRSVEPDKPWHYIAVDRVLRAITDGFTVNANAIGTVLKNREKVAPGRIHTVYNGVDLRVFRPTASDGLRGHLALAPGTFLVGMVGRLAPEKGHLTLLQAMVRVRQEAPQVHVLVVGNGPLENDLRQAAAELTIDGIVTFLPSQRPITQVFEALDLLVVASTFEGCSNVILEAMATGKPVVATAVGGNPELVVSGQTGLLVSSDDPRQLEQAIIELARNRGRAQALGQEGRRRAEERFSLERMVAETTALYSRLMSPVQGTAV